MAFLILSVCASEKVLLCNYLIRTAFELDGEGFNKRTEFTKHHLLRIRIEDVTKVFKIREKWIWKRSSPSWRNVLW